MHEMPRDAVIAEGESVQIKKVGEAFAVILSAELVARLNLSEGDQLRVEQTERGITLAPSNPKHAKAMEIARRSFTTCAETYKALAK